MLNGRSCLYCTEGYVTENRCFGPEETAAVRLAQQRAGLLVTAPWTAEHGLRCRPRAAHTAARRNERWHDF